MGQFIPRWESRGTGTVETRDTVNTVLISSSQDKLREEVHRVIGKERLPALADKNKVSQKEGERREREWLPCRWSTLKRPSMRYRDWPIFSDLTYSERHINLPNLLWASTLPSNSFTSVIYRVKQFLRICQFMLISTTLCGMILISRIRRNSDQRDILQRTERVWGRYDTNTI